MTWKTEWLNETDPLSRFTIYAEAKTDQDAEDIEDDLFDRLIAGYWNDPEIVELQKDPRKKDSIYYDPDPFEYEPEQEAMLEQS